ncbi:hypothetical protein PR202_ga24634 [Eleusine coracana subsp. coracana]|uniref:F-box domain-containing protein n=1 Tax=Eleusine coracana subsp. coracana TaxID=191504 RepID=A0AAV5DA17_ELECO|nr:hypothetical protein PR202_ga24634 [Eleusine coracana subsp. coracana]
MSSRKRCNRAVQAGASAEGIDALPEGLLNHILGFMDARQAVQTCVLAPAVAPPLEVCHGRGHKHD